MTIKTPLQAIAHAKHQSNFGPRFATGTCLIQCRTAYGIAAKYGSAAEAWSKAKYRHRTGPESAPVGALVFWTGGSHRYGHIAISCGGGFCWSTDISRPGHFDRVRITEIARKWGLTYVGWTEDVNGKRVLVAPTNVTHVKDNLLNILNGADARAISPKRAFVVATLRAIKALVNKLPAA